MSRFFKLIPAVIRNRKKIVEGLLNDIRLDHNNLPVEEEDCILERRLICKYCPDNSNTTFPYCELCGCDIKIKTACLSTECGAAEWNKEHPEEVKEVKWQAYEKEGEHKGDS